eukprot:359765-Chlamydomonas_euryale.AAC.2
MVGTSQQHAARAGTERCSAIHLDYYFPPRGVALNIRHSPTTTRQQWFANADAQAAKRPQNGPSSRRENERNQSNFLEFD